MTAVTNTTQRRSLPSLCLSPEGGSFAVPPISANWTSRQESEEIERKPDRHHDRYRGHSNDHRSLRYFHKHLRELRLVYLVIRGHSSLRCSTLLSRCRSVSAHRQAHVADT